MSAIEWTDETWNPTTGCDKVSPGCGLPRPGTDDAKSGRTGGCYALTMAARLNGEFRYKVALSRRRHAPDTPIPPWPYPNIWMGTSIEIDRYAFRADHLRATPAAVRFLSLEPLLGPLPSLDLSGIDWVIAGGESGPGARPMHPDWVRDIRDRCVAAGVPFFFKQWGSWAPGPKGDWTHRVELDGSYARRPTEEQIVADVERGLAEVRAGRPYPDSGWHGMSLLGKKAAGRVLDGRTWDEMPGRRAE